MTQPHLHLLGGFDFAGGGAGEAVLTRKTKAMLAYLAMQSGRPQSREKLASLLWGTAGDSQARMSLRQAVAAVRKATEPAGAQLLADADSLALRLDGLDFDVARFEALARAHEAEDLERALTLYRGDLLDGLSVKEEPFEEWLRVDRQRLRALAVGALDRLLAHHAEKGDAAHCAEAALRLLAMEPLREDVHRALMRAYAAQGRVNLALRQYELCRDALKRELSLPPEPETRQLHEVLRERRKATMALPAHADAGMGHAFSDWARSDAAGGPARPQTHYAKASGTNVAYQVTGDGPVDLVYVSGWVSNLDMAWDSPRLAHVLNRLGSFSRLIRLDKRGTGLSDRNVGLPTLEERMEDVRAVLDQVGSRKPILFGTSEAGPMCLLFAATYPERTAALVLSGAYASGRWSQDYPWARTPGQVDEDIAAVERQWGEPADLSNAAPSLMDNAFEREFFATYLRNSASPADAVALWRWGTEIDVRDILPAIHVPTLVLQRTGDRWVKAEEGRYLAAHIEGARYVELAGRDHLIWGEGCDRLIDEIEAFVTGALPAAPGERVLVSVLSIAFDEAACRGDPAWRDEEVRSQLLLAGGRDIRFTAGGFVAVLQRPTRSIQCAIALRQRLAQAGVGMRAAVHVGECEERADGFSGPAIDLSSWLLAQAAPGEIVVSRTVRDLAAGSGLSFGDLRELDAGAPRGCPQFCPVVTPPA